MDAHAVECAGDLESRWEAKLAALAEAEAALATARAVKPPLPDHETLRALAADLPRLWDAPTTSPRDASGCCARWSPTAGLSTCR